MVDKAGQPAYRLPVGMVRSDVEEEALIFLAQLPSGPIHVLQGPAALIFDAALSVQASAIVTVVAELGGALATDIAEDIQAFVVDLEGLGLIEPVS